jgi:hypothetical protein
VNEPAPNGSRANQGAYGGTAEASKSPPPIHNLTVTQLNAPPSVPQGGLVPVSAVVVNTGGFDEADILVSLSDTTDAVFIGLEIVTALPAGFMATVTFDWDTSLSTIGPHLLLAEAGAVTGESYTTDNSLTST